MIGEVSSHSRVREDLLHESGLFCASVVDKCQTRGGGYGELSDQSLMLCVFSGSG